MGGLDADGYLFITDRKKDMIISGGANVYPRELEEVICTHPAVHEVAIIGGPDETWGESVKAVVVLRPGARASEPEITSPGSRSSSVSGSAMRRSNHSLTATPHEPGPTASHRIIVTTPIWLMP